MSILSARASTRLLVTVCVALSVLVCAGPMATAPPFPNELICFRGIARECQPDSIGGQSWWVSVDELVSGTRPSAQSIRVFNCSGCEEHGYADPGIVPGDLVEVFGVYRVIFDTGMPPYIDLATAEHYIVLCEVSPNECPVAQFEATPTSGSAPLTVTFTDRSYDPDGAIAAAIWDFGDGSFAQAGGTTTHAYRTSGTFNACLSVADDQGCERTKCQLIQVSGTVPPEDCNTEVKGRVLSSPVIDYAPDFGHFMLQITDVLRDDSTVVFVGQTIEVRVTVQAASVLSQIGQGDCVEVCGVWDTEIYCGETGYVRKTQCSAEALGCIGGWARDADSQVGIPGAQVEVVSGPTTGRATSDSNGYFKLCNLKPGDYRIGATKAGYNLVAFAHLRVTGGAACDRCSRADLSMRRVDQGKPDLIVTQVTCSPAQPTVGVRVFVSVVVQNVGTASAGSFSTSLSANGTALGSKDSTGLASGATATLSFEGWGGIPAWNWLNECGRDHRLSAVADSGNQVAESNENNNERSQSVRVQCLPALIRDWLIIGPFTYSPSEAQKAFGMDYLQGEGTVSPGPGTTSGGKQWREHHDSDDYIDFDALCSPNDTAVAYAHVYVNSPREQALQLRIGSDDAVKVWLNGQLVFENYVERAALPDQDIRSITLKSGWNGLLIKVLERYGGWGSYARLTDAAGNAVPGLTYSLTPPAGEVPDLVVDSLILSPEEPVRDATLKVDVHVKNQGKGTAGAFSVELYADDVSIGRQEISSLAPGATSVVTFTGNQSSWAWMKKCDAYHSLKAVADSMGTIQESDEDNNVLDRQVLVNCIRRTFEGLEFSASCASGTQIGCRLHYDNKLGEKAVVVFLLRKQPGGELVAHRAVEAAEGVGDVEASLDCPLGSVGTYRASWMAYARYDQPSTISANCDELSDASGAELLLGDASRASILKYDRDGDGAIGSTEGKEAFDDYVFYSRITKLDACAVMVFNARGVAPADRSAASEDEDVACPCAGEFVGEEFTSQCIAQGEFTGQVECTLRYRNNLGENVTVLFLFKKAETGEVVGQAAPIAPPGDGQAGGLFECKASGRYRISWKAYRTSDTKLLNPVAECKAGQEIEVTCPCAGGQAQFIRDWLIIGPFTYSASGARQAFETDSIQGETTTQPGQQVTSGGKQWREQHDSDDYIDFNSLFSPNDTAVAYANVYVNSPREQAVQLRVGSDDAVKVWLNGLLVHENYADRPAAPDQDIKAITLRSGWNRLLVKVLERYGDWGFYARLTDTGGNALTGLDYSLASAAGPAEGEIEITSVEVGLYDVSEDGWKVTIKGRVPKAYGSEGCDWGDKSGPTWDYSPTGEFDWAHVYRAPGTYTACVYAPSVPKPDISRIQKNVVVEIPEPSISMPSPARLDCDDLKMDLIGAQHGYAWIEDGGAKITVELVGAGGCALEEGDFRTLRITVTRDGNFKKGSCTYTPACIKGTAERGSLFFAFDPDAIELTEYRIAVDGKTKIQADAEQLVNFVMVGTYGVFSSVLSALRNTLLKAAANAFIEEAILPRPQLDITLTEPDEFAGAGGFKGLNVDLTAGSEPLSLASATELVLECDLEFKEAGNQLLYILPDVRFGTTESGCEPWLASTHFGSFWYRREIMVSCNVAGSEPLGEFSAVSFSCESHGAACRCSLAYDNQLGEAADVDLVCYDPSTGRVVRQEWFTAGTGTGTITSSDYPCTIGSTSPRVLWRAYRASAPKDLVAYCSKEAEAVCCCQRADSGCIKGVVKTADTLPVPDVRVDVAGAVSQSARTNRLGEYEFKDIPVGDGYSVQVLSPARYKPKDPVRGVGVKVGACAQVDFVLEERPPDEKTTGCICGRVVSAGGGPIDGVTLSLSGPTSKSPTTTNSAGRYRFAGLLAGDYSVRITSAGDYELPLPKDGIRVIAPSSGESCVTLDDFALALSDSSKPDLRVKSLTLNPSTAAPGQAVQVKLSISNTGRAQAKQYRVSFYLGLTENDTSIVPFSTITVDGGTLGKRTSDVQASLVLPSRQSSGSFYVVAFVDSHGQVVESSEDNNVKGSCLRVRPSTGIKSVLFEATGPVDLELVDPDGRVLDAESMAASGVLYSYVDLDDDEIVDVELVIPEAVAGVYQVRTIPRPEAQSDDRVSLTAIEGGRATKLVPDSATIADLDPQGTEYLARPGGTAWLVLVPGLNFVSLALEPDPAAPRDVFDEMADLDIRHWDSSARKWATERNGLLSLLAPMQGYWVLASAETLIGVEGTPLSGEQSLALSKSGWQQVGVPYEVAWGASGGGTVRVEHAGETESLRGAMDRGWVSGAAWTWDGAAQEWVTLRADRGATLMPWIGYWLYTYIDDVTLRFSETPGGGVISMAAMEPRGGPPPVTVDAEAVAEPVDETLALLRVVSVPNPTGDETVFEVRGVCTCRVDGLRVTVYDLAGQQIWAGHSASAELPWDTRNELGEPLPNGMYLAVALVRVDGRWESAPVWKLAIVR